MPSVGFRDGGRGQTGTGVPLCRTVTACCRVGVPTVSCRHPPLKPYGIRRLRCPQSAAAAASGRHSVSAEAAENNKGNDDDPNIAVVEEIAETVHNVTSYE